MAGHPMEPAPTQPRPQVPTHLDPLPIAVARQPLQDGRWGVTGRTVGVLWGQASARHACTPSQAVLWWYTTPCTHLAGKRLHHNALLVLRSVERMQAGGWFLVHVLPVGQKPWLHGRHSCRAVPCLALPCHVMPYHAIPCQGTMQHGLHVKLLSLP